VLRWSDPGVAVAETAGGGNRVPPDQVRAMFDRIAPVYDAMNTLMTAGLDRRWRHAAGAATGLRPGMRAVDVACGSGALTSELTKRVGPTGRVLGVDVSTEMLRRAARRRTAGVRPVYEVGDALDLPIPDAEADATTIAFGLRNVADYRRCLAEMARVTRPGGRVVVLEIATPTSRLGRAVAGTWFRRVVPLVGRLAGGGSAYRYLPTSVDAYPPPAAVAAMLARVGLVEVTWRRLTLGMVTLHVGQKA
jgi:demethylmenaquinone methyltransferase / 2-methoxy-6-polyprenyl-1,4-benzoquinol methylase